MTILVPIVFWVAIAANMITCIAGMCFGLDPHKGPAARIFWFNFAVTIISGLILIVEHLSPV